MTRIAIIGNAGGGKSMLAQHLSRVLDLPMHSIDNVQWKPEWTRAPADDVARAHTSWLQHDRWIIDGWGSWELIGVRFSAADTIVIVDFPLRVHVRWALQRQVEVALGLRSDWPPPGCAAWPITRRLLRLMYQVDKELRPRLLALAMEPRFANRVVYLRSPCALQTWKASIDHTATRPPE